MRKKILQIAIMAIVVIVQGCGGTTSTKNWDTSNYKIKVHNSGNFITLIVPPSHYEEFVNPNLSIKNDYIYNFSKKLLNHFKDNFNHITIVNNNFKTPLDNYTTGGLSIGIKNDIQGIGKKIYDHSAKCDSNGTLKSIIHIPSISTLYVYYHEFLHQFSNHFIPTIKSGHYGFSTGGVLGGFSNETLEQLSENKYKASYKGLKSFGIAANRTYSYSSLDLYLMGLAPKDELSTIKIVKCDKYLTTSINDDCPYWIDKPKGIFYANSIENITIDELVSQHGEREPNYKNSPKIFRGIVVLISPNTISSKNLKKMDEMVEKVMKNFRESTLGRGELKLDDLFSLEK